MKRIYLRADLVARVEERLVEVYIQAEAIWQRHFKLPVAPRFAASAGLNMAVHATSTKSRLGPIFRYSERTQASSPANDVTFGLNSFPAKDLSEPFRLLKTTLRLC
jgi:hypothetical protein